MGIMAEMSGLFSVYAALWALPAFLSSLGTVFVVLYVLGALRGQVPKLGAKTALALVGTVAAQLAVLGVASAMAAWLSGEADAGKVIRAGLGVAVAGTILTALTAMFWRTRLATSGASVARQALDINAAIAGLACVALVTTTAVLIATGARFGHAAAAGGIYLAFSGVLFVLGARDEQLARPVA
jgi:hypothetical protein